MATIRIADTPHPKDEFPRTNSQDAVSSGIGDRLERVDTHDDIYNIRSRSKAPSLDRRSSRLNRIDKEDDDPGLRKPGDYKQKQVPTDPMANLCNLSSISAGIQGKNASVACLSINRCHLWRHRDQSSLRLLVDVQFGSLTSGPHWGAIDNHLDSVHDGDGEIRVCHPSCR
jgi:hypothetical protein